MKKRFKLTDLDCANCASLYAAASVCQPPFSKKLKWGRRCGILTLFFTT